MVEGGTTKINVRWKCGSQVKIAREVTSIREKTKEEMILVSSLNGNYALFTNCSNHTA